MKPKFNIGDLVEHTEHNALGLVVNFNRNSDPIIEIVKSGHWAHPEGQQYVFFTHQWKHTEE
jgi:hypothetical protein